MAEADEEAGAYEAGCMGNIFVTGHNSQRSRAEQTIFIKFKA